MWFNQYPYINVNDLNLDYLLKSVKQLRYDLENFVNINTIKYANPIQWNITKQYEANTVVIDANDGTAYLSVKPVPSGVALTNTDYWTPIFTLNLLSANQNITLRDDSSNVLATFASVEGDWLIWNNTLYKVTQAINVNEAYVVGYNLTRYSVEMFINDYISNLANMIGDLDDLTTTDKDNIVDALNEVKALADKVDKRVNYNCASDFALDSTGVNDCSTALAAITDNVALMSGTYKISADCTINAEVVFCNGAVMNIDSGVTVTFKKQVIANPDSKIFDGAGDAIVHGFVYPEWYGAVVNDNLADNSGAINKAYASCNALKLNGGYYYVANTVYFNKSGVSVTGIGNGRSYDNPNAQSVIVTADTSITIVDIGNADGLWNGVYSNFGVYRNVAGDSGAIGVNIHNTLFARFEKLYVRSATCFYCDANVKPMFDGCLLMPRVNDVAGAAVRGFDFINVAYNTITNLRGNASTYIINCSIEGQQPTNAIEIGLHWQNGLSDLFIDGLECGMCSRGVLIDGNNEATMHDITLKRVVVDNYSAYGCRITNCDDVEVVVEGGYFYGAQNAFSLQSLRGNVVISHVNIYLATVNPNAAFYVNNCIGVTMRDNVCHGSALLNLQGTCSRIISDDAAISEGAGGVLIYAAGCSASVFRLRASGTGTNTYGLYAGTLSNSIVDVTMIRSGQIATGLAYIAGTTYNAVGAAGSNQITGIYT